MITHVPFLSRNGLRQPKLLRPKVHSSILDPSKLVKIALRRKSSKNSEPCGSKLHVKLLEAGLRIRLIMTPSIYELYRQLTPHTARTNALMHIHYQENLQKLAGRDILHVLKTHRGHRPASRNGYSQLYSGTPEKRRDLENDIHNVSVKSEDDCNHTEGPPTPDGATENNPYLLYSGDSLCKRVRLIDSNLVNISRVSNKVLKAFAENDDESTLSTFNNLDTAVSSLFGTRDYSVVRVTRSASSSQEASTLLKLESAAPGDLSLIDDRDFMEDMLASLGRSGQAPNSIFLKKVVARPRYKSDMKIYIVPTVQPTLLYVNERVFVRDLVNGVIDLDVPPERRILTTFPAEKVLAQVLDIFYKTSLLEKERLDSPPDVPGSVSSGSTGLNSSQLLPSIMSAAGLSGLSNTDISSELTPDDLLYIPNKKMGPDCKKNPVLEFDTEYAPGGL